MEYINVDDANQPSLYLAGIARQHLQETPLKAGQPSLRDLDS